MALLDKLLKRGNRSASEEVESPSCPHSAIVPRWDSLEDMGKEQLISGYHCDACGEDFNRAEGQLILQEETTRLREEAARLEEEARRAEEEQS